MLTNMLKQLFRKSHLGGFKRVLTEFDAYQRALFEAEDINRIVTTRYGLMIYNRNDYVVGRSLETYGEWCQKELDLLAGYIRPGMTVCDVGAHIGTHTLFFSRAVGSAGKVYAFEPQRVVFQVLAGNAALNSLQNVWCRQVALGSRSGSAAIPAVDYGSSDNFGAIALREAGRGGETVPISRIDDLGLASIGLIKIDVEGMEKDVLEGAANTIRGCRPVIYVENNREGQAGALVEYVDLLGYDMYWHSLQYYNADNFAGEKRNIFSTAGETNMLCLPRGTVPPEPALSRVTVPFAGLRR